MHQYTSLTCSDAQAIIAAIVTPLLQQQKGAAIAVVDNHGELLAFARTDGCPLPSITIAQNKAYTAARQRKPSAEVGQASRNEGFPMSNFGELRYVTWGGGLPVVHEGEVIGAVGVSGLPEQEDIEWAASGIRAWQGN